MVVFGVFGTVALVGDFSEKHRRNIKAPAPFDKFFRALKKKTSLDNDFFQVSKILRNPCVSFLKNIKMDDLFWVFSALVGCQKATKVMLVAGFSSPRSDF